MSWDFGLTLNLRGQALYHFRGLLLRAAVPLNV